ncbi:hypothetical protein CEW88_04820 [Alloyangia pacifica]|uniref:Uncharacterized protein n=1 Tax=Alloyangia pacifica TaxID=311180 RepID=A0A2U8HBD4_9RHOB|nr:hypothetical protein [Alloyangia pacifica]AWI83043.1 hypothetical protein CEW88_04820 [Alloyangia pacifica]
MTTDFTTDFRSDMEKHAWGMVESLPEFHWTDLTAKGIAQHTAQAFVRRWQQTGRIRLSRRDEQQRKLFVSAARAIPVLPPRAATDRQATPEGNMWRTMRRLVTFTPTDLAAHSNAGGVEVTLDKARAYCRQMLSADYLKVRETAIPGRREPRYRLIRDTGPLAPRTRQLTGIFDPNDNRFMPADREVAR